MTRRAKAALAVCSAFFLVAGLHASGVLVPFEELLRSLFAKPASLLSSFGGGISDRWQQAGSLGECREQLTDLESRLSSLSVDYVRLRALEEENAVLRKTLAYAQSQGYDAVMAQVISRSITPDRAYFLIDRGSRDGLENGMAVVTGEGIFLGKITTIRERTSIVTLTADPASRVAVSMPGKHKLIGLVEGRGNGTAEVTLIPQQEAIQTNDILTTSGTEDKVPADLVVGLVNQVVGQPTDPFKRASLEPVVHSESVEIVSVLRSQALRPSS